MEGEVFRLLPRRLGSVVRGERGFLAFYLLVMYVVFALTSGAFLFGLGLGLWKQAQAKHGWFSEALNFAARAPGAAVGTGQEVVLDQDLARQYFEAAMEELVGEYTLMEFRAVQPGEPVPGGMAQAPGFLARVKVPVFAGRVPFLGYQEVDVPMTAFAVAVGPELP